jgi:hypothetical protein
MRRVPAIHDVKPVIRKQARKIRGVEVPKMEWMGQVAPVNTFQFQSHRGAIRYRDVQFGARAKQPGQLRNLDGRVGKVLETVAHDSHIERSRWISQFLQLTRVNGNTAFPALFRRTLIEVDTLHTATAGLQINQQITKPTTDFKHPAAHWASQRNVDIELPQGQRKD